jgi:hypothetical protein
MDAYACRVVRNHVQSRLPLPTAEIEPLKVTVADVNAVGRELNKVARAVNQGESVDGPSRSDLKRLLNALIRMHDCVQPLLCANRRSWPVIDGSDTDC